MIPPAAHAVRQPGRGARRADRARGSTIVEFAIVLPLFLALVFGMIDGGRLMMARWLVTYAIDKGGRVASLRPPTTTTLLQVQQAVSQTASMIGLPTNTVNVDVTGVCVPCTTDAAFNSRVPGNTVRVYTTFVFKRALPFVFRTATLNIVGSTRTTVE